ncbi:MAG TPA: agmatinase, partial [Chitinophagaceae bacterium]|nr:agmatinase [Chitinophagaceae bacterium]
SHASIMYNTLEEVKAVSKIVQVGIRDYCQEEYEYIQANPERLSVFFDRDIKERQY